MSPLRELTLGEGVFRAFGSNCRIVSDLGESAIHRSVQRLEDLEARWSRFRSDSEISELNRSAGEWVGCSEATVDLVRRAVEAARRTNELFNPLVLPALVALGYDRDHRELCLDAGEVSRGLGMELPSPAAIEIVGGSIRLPPLSGFDPGGIGKGLAADLVLEDLIDAGARWAHVSLGGDVRFGGSELDLEGTVVQIQHPIDRDSAWGETRIRHGALASSSTLVRRWRHRGSTHHHLVDRTGRSAGGPRVAATVHAPTAWWADVVAKCLLIDARLGREDLEAWQASALVFDRSGAVAAFGWADDRDLPGAV